MRKFSDVSEMPCPRSTTEVQRVSFVGSTNADCHPHSLCNLQNLHAVPPQHTRTDSEQGQSIWELRGTLGGSESK